MNTTGKLALGIAFAEGQGGPANSLVSSQVIYQVALNWIFRGYLLTVMQIVGIFFGILSTLIISMGDMMVEYLYKGNNESLK